MAGTFSSLMLCGPSVATMPMATPKPGRGRVEWRTPARNWNMAVRPLVVSSQIVDVGTAQADGRFWVTERHTFADGSTQDVMTLMNAGADTNAIIVARAQAMNATIAALNDAEAIPTG